MLLKLLVLVAAVTFAVADSEEPRKLYKSVASEKVPTAPFTDPFDGKFYRLPNTTIPIRYDIWLSTEIHSGNFTFEGRVKIEIMTVETTPNITLHYRQLTIHNVDFLDSAGNTIQSNVPTTSQDDLEFLVITPAIPLVAGTTYHVLIDYEGVLRNDDAGFYRSSYTDLEGKTVWLATTQFESTDARHGFPCYDEPAKRSAYSIEIRHHSSYHAISNMPEASRTVESDQNYVVTKFEVIPSIQSYLIAFIISDFNFVQDAAGSVNQRVYAKPQSLSDGHGKLALEVSRPILEGFENYLGINYSLPKMDQAAMPDFDAGAMENWGLVTYREQYLLFNEATGTARNRENVIATIAHEFAHQWFGNLVSPAWWSFLWLNEGFATLFESHILHVVYPNERWLDTFLIDTVQPVFESDASPNTRPMSFYVEAPESIENLFDNVAYSKSGSVLKMFQNAFGDATWSKGLSQYLTDREMNYGTPDYLYAGLQRAVDADFPTEGRPVVATVMKSWETQAGFPYVTVSMVSGNSLTFEQNRFMYADRTSQSLWWVPVNYYTESMPDFTSTKADFWIPGTKSSALISGVNAPKEFKESDWIVVNTQQSGYYRVNYDQKLWNALINKLSANATSHNQIHLFNRAQLIDDSYHLARAGLINYDVLFGIMNYLEKETDYIPWASMNRAYTLLNRWVSGSRISAEYQTFMRKNVEALFNRLDVNVINNEQRVDRYARVVAINIACQSRLPSCLTKTTAKLNNFIANNIPIEPELVSTIYCNGIRGANSTEFMAMQFKMLTNPTPSDKNAMITGLGCTHDTTLLESYFRLAVSGSTQLVNTQSVSILASATNQGEASIRTMINFLKDNAAGVSTYANINSMCANIASRISNLDLLSEFNVLVDLLETNGYITAQQKSTYQNSANAIPTWQSENLDSIESFFLQVLPTDAPTDAPPATSEPTTAPPTTAAPTTAPPTTSVPTTAPPTTAPPTTSAPTTVTPAPATTDGAGNIFLSSVILIASLVVKFSL